MDKSNAKRAKGRERAKVVSGPSNWSTERCVTFYTCSLREGETERERERERKAFTNRLRCLRFSGIKFVV